MNLFENLNEIRLVKVGPGLRERLERRIAGAHHEAVIARLRHFRQSLERDTEPESWTALEAPMVLILSDLCDALQLNEQERASVLGAEGVLALADELEARVYPKGGISVINERQSRALLFVERCGMINLAAYRRMFPNLSAETLRLDLAGLVRLGLLCKNGRKKGAHYVLPEASKGGQARA